MIRQASTVLGCSVSACTLAQSGGTLTYGPTPESAAPSADALSAPLSVPVPSVVLLLLSLGLAWLGLRALRTQGGKQLLGLALLAGGLGASVLSSVHIQQAVAAMMINLDQPGGGTVDIPISDAVYTNTSGVSLTIGEVVAPPACATSGPDDECVSELVLANGESCSTVYACSQSIRFTSTAPNNAIVDGTSYEVAATASSGLPVEFTAGSDACSISGSTVSMVSPGECVINANQAGDADYESAPEAQQRFTVRINFVINPNRIPEPQNDEVSAKADTPASFTVLENDSDPDNDPLRITSASCEAGAVSYTNTTVDWDPNGEFPDLFRGQSTTVACKYSVSDGRVEVPDVPLSIRVDGVGVFNTFSIASEASCNQPLDGTWSYQLVLSATSSDPGNTWTVNIPSYTPAFDQPLSVGQERRSALQSSDSTAVITNGPPKLIATFAEGGPLALDSDEFVDADGLFYRIDWPGCLPDYPSPRAACEALDYVYSEESAGVEYACGTSSSDESRFGPDVVLEALAPFCKGVRQRPVDPFGEKPEDFSGDIIVDCIDSDKFVGQAECEAVGGTYVFNESFPNDLYLCENIPPLSGATREEQTDNLGDILESVGQRCERLFSPDFQSDPFTERWTTSCRPFNGSP